MRIMSGRPLLFANSKQVNVRVTLEDYTAIRTRVETIARMQAGFTIGDLIRDYIHRGLDADGAPRRETDAKAARVRTLRTIGRTALRLAQEYEKTA